VFGIDEQLDAIGQIFRTARVVALSKVPADHGRIIARLCSLCRQ
jgi:hypothetical protein